MTQPSAVSRGVSILGATGSIGNKALAVCERYPDRFHVVSLAAHRSAEAMAELAARHPRARLVLTDEAAAQELRSGLDDPARVGAGASALAALAADPAADVVVNGVVGRAGLEASLAAASHGKLLALANKESLVLAGELLRAAANAGRATLIPVDSEHAGLYQCLEGRAPKEIRRLTITASGGPFRGKRRRDLSRVTPDEALNHPIWPMGPRITVDSATLFNKGLEVIETRWLFDVPYADIGVYVHPQSVVHALVEFRDGSVLAQMAAPDMLLPVQYAMTFPERLDCEVPPCHLPEWGSLQFEEPDLETFPALGLAYRAGEAGGTAPAVLNAADEVAVAAFLEGRLPFLEIAETVARVLDAVPVEPADSVEAIVRADAAGRAAARGLVGAGSP